MSNPIQRLLYWLFITGLGWLLAVRPAGRGERMYNVLIPQSTVSEPSAGTRDAKALRASEG